MADIIRRGASVRSLPFPRTDDLVERILSLRTDAKARGFGTLTHLLEAALLEARYQADRGSDGVAAGAPPSGREWTRVGRRN